MNGLAIYVERYIVSVKLLVFVLIFLDLIPRSLLRQNNRRFKLKSLWLVSLFTAFEL